MKKTATKAIFGERANNKLVVVSNAMNDKWYAMADDKILTFEQFLTRHIEDWLSVKNTYVATEVS